MNKNSKYKLCRKYGGQKQYKFIYIFTEGEKTEVNYLESKKKEIEKETRKKQIQIKITGTAYNTLSLVKYALDFIKRENIETEINECWVVFDKDNFNKDFNIAIDKALANNLKVAYSNECFELWFLLHFIPLTSAISGTDYISKLSIHLRKLTGNPKIKYSKTSTDIYSLIKSREKDAIRDAKKLLKIHKNEKSFLKKNPSTTVHLLVEDLNKIKNSNSSPTS